MRILALETHAMGKDGEVKTSAVDYWRVINPLKHTDLDVTYRKFLFAQNEDDKDADRVYREVGENFDILFTSYIDGPKAYAYLKAAQKKYGFTHVMDLDDNIYSVDKYSVVYRDYNPGSPKTFIASQIIEDVNYLTVTTPYLDEITKKNGRDKPTYVLPNYIDLNTYKFDFTTKKKPDKKIVILYQGSATHYSDIAESGFMEASKMISKKYGNKVKFRFIGMPPIDFEDALPKGRVEFVNGCSDFYDWIKIWQKEMARVDIAVAPLIDSEFNKGKSNIKFMEASACKVPMVCSRAGTYPGIVKHNETGFLVDNDPEDWFEHLSMLIENEILRRKMGDMAYEDIKENWTIQKHAHKYEEVLSNL